LFERLERDGFAEEITLDRALVLRQLDSRYKKAELVAIAEKTPVSAHGLKAELLARLLDAGQIRAQKAVRPTERFATLIVALVDVYLGDIRRSIDRFHPAYLEWVWEEVANANRGRWRYLDDRIEGIRNERYWASRLTAPESAGRRARQWWKFWPAR
jgi:hypothetical protein